jgi:hypothetical protein
MWPHSSRPARAAEANPLRVELSFSKQALAEPFTGRVFLLVSKAAIAEAPHLPRRGAPSTFAFGA